ncbi:hypothetical protein SAMN02194393_00593 [Maledivibacter halophilus]|uniref:Uncharacterized protein n=1 Tax=Maledivibacter halophilus TaxID=36842 RepID=A0A1T5IP56_9FIRM|nr:hypothetical protein SAMN02194393_00593 [Maledivibacter halophilus]
MAWVISLIIRGVILFLIMVTIIKFNMKESSSESKKKFDE